MLFSFRTLNIELKNYLLFTVPIIGVLLFSGCQSSQKKIGASAEEIKQFYNASDEHYATDEIYKSLESAEEGLRLSHQSGNNELVVKGILLNQRAYGYLGLPDYGLLLHKTYEKEVNACKDIKLLIRLHNNIGILESNLKHYDSSEYHYLKSIDLAKENTENDLLCSGYLNLAALYHKKCDFSSALSYYDTAEYYLSKASENRSLKYRYFILMGRGNVELDLNQIDSGSKKVNRVLSAIEAGEIKDFALKSWAQYEFVQYLIKAGKHEKALFHIEEYIDQSKTNSPNLATIEYYEELIELCDFLDLPEKKIKYLEDFLRVKTKYNELNIARINKKNEVINSIEKRTIQERKEKELSLERNKNQQLLLIASILGIIAALLLAYILWKRYLKTKSSNVRLKKKSEQLNSEIEQRDSVITNKILQLSQQQNFILSIKKELDKKVNEDGMVEKRAISRRLDELNSKQNKGLWLEFEAVFENLHQGFFEALLSAHPKLTPNERKLCAFIRLNMETHEISSITGQSKHSIKIARGRLRKKLGLTHSETSLYEFISRY